MIKDDPYYWRKFVTRQSGVGIAESRTADCYETLSVSPKMMNVIYANGQQWALSYADLHLVQFFEGAIQLSFNNFTVKIGGRNLEPIRHAVSNHRVSWLKVDPESKDETMISAIQITRSGR